MNLSPFGPKDRARPTKTGLVNSVLTYFTSSNLDADAYKVEQIVGKYKVTIQVTDVTTSQPAK